MTKVFRKIMKFTKFTKFAKFTILYAFLYLFVCTDEELVLQRRLAEVKRIKKEKEDAQEALRDLFGSAHWDLVVQLFCSQIKNIDMFMQAVRSNLTSTVLVMKKEEMDDEEELPTKRCNIVDLLN